MIMQPYLVTNGPYTSERCQLCGEKIKDCTYWESGHRHWCDTCLRKHPDGSWESCHDGIWRPVTWDTPAVVTFDVLAYEAKRVFGPEASVAIEESRGGMACAPSQAKVEFKGLTISAVGWYEYQALQKLYDHLRGLPQRTEQPQEGAACL